MSLRIDFPRRRLLFNIIIFLSPPLLLLLLLLWLFRLKTALGLLTRIPNSLLHFL